MRIIKNEVWDVEGNGVKTITFTADNSMGDAVASEMYVNPLSDVTVTVTGYVDKADSTGTVLKCIDIANLEKVDAVTKKGDYCYMVGSFYRVKIEVNGSSKVIIKYLW